MEKKRFKMMQLTQISQEQFIKVGKWCFLIIFLMGILIFMDSFNRTSIFEKISSIAGLIFNFALFLMFRHLDKTLNSHNLPETSAEEMKAAFEEVAK